MRRAGPKALVAGSVVVAGAFASTEASAQCLAQFPGSDHQIAITVSNPAAARGDTFLVFSVDTQTPIAAGRMNADGSDIRIATSACDAVPFWIERDIDTTSTKIWMRMHNVAAGDQQVDLYYGNASSATASDLSAVFGAGLLGLFTFSEGGGTTVGDYVGPNTMTMSGTSWSVGPLPGVGAASSFASGRLNVSGGGPTLGDDFTALSFIKPSSVPGTTAGIFGNYKSDKTSGWGLKLQGAAGQFMLITNENGSWCQDGGGSLKPNAWQFIGARRQYGSTNANTLFQDGVPIKDICPGDSRNVNGPGPFEIGHQYDGTMPFPGDISISMLFGRALADAEVAGLDSALRIANPPKVTLVGAPPGAPTIGTATANGTTGHVTFAAPSDTGAGPITRYEVSCSPDGTATGPANPVDVPGLTPAQPHACKVRAYNAYGAGPWSADSNQFVPGGAPSFSSAANATFTVLANAAFTIVAAGQPAPTLDVTGSLPPGLTVVDGILQGTPASGSVGAYPVTVTASNGILPNATQNLSIEVKKATQTISFAPLEHQILGAQKVQVSATSSAALPLALASTTTPVCTISAAGAISLHAVGVCTITAAQAGNIDYEAAATVTQSFQVELRPPNDGDASASTPDASTSSKPDSSAIYPPDASSGASGLRPDSIQGGGCQCDASGGSAPVGGLLFAGLGLLLGRARRLRRSK
jgi:hypothetical protein